MLTVAVFDRTSAWVGVTVILTCSVASAASVPSVQSTVVTGGVDVSSELLQVPVVGTAETRVTPSGSGSVTCTSEAGSGPSLCTARS